MSRYNDAASYYKEQFGGKVARITIDGGFTCPNRDGRVGSGGCIFCSGRGSGDFCLDSAKSIKEQIEAGKESIKKWEPIGYIAYFQAFTNTYAPVLELEKKYNEAISCDGVVGLSIATRPDCIDDEITELLKKISKKTKLWVELGFQTSNENTARLINRCYCNEVFDLAVRKLSDAGIPVIAHVILYLPNETESDMTETINYINRLPIHGIKLHLLHVLKDTVLEDMYKNGDFTLPNRDEYADMVCKLIAMLRSDIVIYRMTGDGSGDALIAPSWSRDKKKVLAAINSRLKRMNITQGCECKI